MNWIGWVTFGIAVVGATLGVFNAFWMIRRDTVRLRVRGVTLILPTAASWAVGVEVINTGYVAVSITEAAFRRGRFARKRIVLPSDFFGEISFPHRLEARTSITVAASPTASREFMGMGLTHCSTRTACGIEVIAKIKWSRD